MSRFNILRVRPANKPGATLAFFDFVDTQTGVEYRDFVLLKGSNGTFVKSPFKEFEGRDGPARMPFVRAERDNELGQQWFDEVCVEAETALVTSAKDSVFKPVTNPTTSGKGAVAPSAFDDEGEWNF